MNGFVCLDASEGVHAVGDLDRIERADCEARFSAKALVDAVEDCWSGS